MKKSLSEMSQAVSAQARCGDPEPLLLIEEAHALQLELCDLLECLADSLPDRFSRGIACVAASLLRQSFDTHQRLEEAKLFPLLRRRAAQGSPIALIVDRLEDEHAADQDLASELADELQLLADTGIARNPEMLGFMLRGFFQSQRRHIGWESTVLLPLARQTLQEEDLVELQSWIMSSARPACAKYSVAAIERLNSGPGACRVCPSCSGSVN